MQLCKVRLATGETRVGTIAGQQVRLLKRQNLEGLSAILHAENPRAVVADHGDERAGSSPLEQLTLLAPVDAQEVWAAGVTYKRSQEARERESVGAAKFY